MVETSKNPKCLHVLIEQPVPVSAVKLLLSVINPSPVWAAVMVVNKCFQLPVCCVAAGNIPCHNKVSCPMVRRSFNVTEGERKSLTPVKEPSSFSTTKTDDPTAAGVVLWFVVATLTWL